MPNLIFTSFLVILLLFICDLRCYCLVPVVALVHKYAQYLQQTKDAGIHYREKYSW